MPFNLNTKIIRQGAQRCQDNCTIPTKNLKKWEYLGRGVSLLSDFRLKMPTFLRTNQKNNETKTNKETNTHTKKKKNAKNPNCTPFQQLLSFLIAVLIL